MAHSGNRANKRKAVFARADLFNRASPPAARGPAALGIILRSFITADLKVFDQLVGVTAVGPRFLVHYRRTLIAEIDPLKSRSTAVDRD